MIDRDSTDPRFNPYIVGGHKWVADPPWSERMVCEKCSAWTTYATLRRAPYGEEFGSCEVTDA